ncbi:DUF4192 domain-containing protein [Antrihabitans cavernicola]|uniref:DUF4192 domain-containing protein n=1 Tax=Antrihabitans cavernicola TaxID=2495913 RepID=A0A5A7SDV3_9NOCA|nr:DUF4192 domain-containing protein [Spelaeibacter cavernicola]KAA0023372.1 DUF4192 domain-containing protein [Spelaeibacter cavernicola]
MTTSTTPHDPLEAWREPLRVSDPADLIVAVPALLGFHPHRSLVIVCLGGGSASSVGAVLRHDLIPPDRSGHRSDRMIAAVEQFGAICGNEGARAALAVIVDDVGDRESYDDVVGMLAASLAANGAELVGAHVTACIEAGQRWWSLLGDPRSGVLPDPFASRVAAAHVLEGRQIWASRSELSGLLDGGDDLERRAVADAVDQLREGALFDRLGSRSRVETPREVSRARLDLVLWQITTVASGERLQPIEFAELVLALDDRVVRDAAMALAVGDDAVAAERLWIELARVAPDPYRADAATLFGYCAYVRGDGPLAGIAFSAALESNPAHGAAGLLDSALQHGIRPELVRKLADTGFDCARRLGVDLPPPT